MNAKLGKLQIEKNELLKQFNFLAMQHKNLYSNIDISEPKSEQEKKSEQTKNELYSKIDKIVREIRQEKILLHTEQKSYKKIGLPIR